MKHSKIRSLLSGYKPSWFYFSSALGNVMSEFLPPKKVPEHESITVRSKSGQGGLVCYDVVRSEAAPESKKIVFIIPGVNCSLADHHINSTVRQAVSHGYHCVLVNPVRPDLSRDVSDLEVIDYSRTEPVTESIEAIKEIFGEDS